MAFEVMNDCIHLKACRRVQAIGKKHRLIVPRYCTEDCTAYTSMGEVLEEVENAVRWAFDRGKDGDDCIVIKDTEGFEDLLRGQADCPWK